MRLARLRVPPYVSLSRSCIRARWKVSVYSDQSSLASWWWYVDVHAFKRYRKSKDKSTLTNVISIRVIINC